MNLGGRVRELRLGRGWKQIDVCERIPGLSQQALGQLEKRDSANSKFASQLAHVFDVPLEWLLTGRYPTPRSGGLTIDMPQPLRLSDSNMPPTRIAWEALMTTDLANEFETELPDDAMAPHAPRGTRVIFVAGPAPEAGHWVLVRDRDGLHYCREYRLVKPGRWQAHAVNPAYLPMDSDEHGLTVVAVFDGMRGRRSPR